jgi:hypothetical protein
MSLKARAMKRRPLALLELGSAFPCSKETPLPDPNQCFAPGYGWYPCPYYNYGY